MMRRLGFFLVLSLLMATVAGADPTPGVQELAPGSDGPAWLSESGEVAICFEGTLVDGIGDDQDPSITYLSCTTYLQCVEQYFQCASGCFYVNCGTLCQDQYAACLANVC